MTGNHHINKTKKTLNGRWSKSQHQRFIKGYEKFGRNWVQVQKIVKTRSLTQVRSHAQKVFLNTEQSGLNFSVDSDDSALISYRDQSSSEEQIQNELNFNSNKQQLKPIIKSQNKSLLQSFVTVLSKQKIEPEHQQTKQQDITSPKINNLPSKQILQNYLSNSETPSHFLISLTHEWNILNNGGNFLQLCLGAPQHNNLPN